MFQITCNIEFKSMYQISGAFKNSNSFPSNSHPHHPSISSNKSSIIPLLHNLPLSIPPTQTNTPHLLKIPSSTPSPFISSKELFAFLTNPISHSQAMNSLFPDTETAVIFKLWRSVNMDWRKVLNAGLDMLGALTPLYLC
jgi:hypothetical protein